MITRFGETSIIYLEQGATFSDCETWRYALWRTWDRSLPTLAWLLLNPATATEGKSDPTNTRGERRARMWGYGTNLFLNAFAFRSVSPKIMKAQPDPVGPDNDAVILEWLAKADTVIAGWGTHGSHLGRDKEVLALCEKAGKPLMALRVTKDGHPAHLLYLPYSVEPTPFKIA